VIDVYRMVRQRFPDVQLVLAGSMAHDDPEGMAVYHECLAHADRDPSIIILSNMDNVGAVEVNAFQCLADVVVQKSLREGFGLTVSEALWKARPTVGGAVGGIRLQIEDGVTGWLCDSPETCAEACLDVLRDPEDAHRVALAGKEHVRRNFLTPRLVLDWLRLMTALREGTTYAEVRDRTAQASS
jgi:trehalose synthase